MKHGLTARILLTCLALALAAAPAWALAGGQAGDLSAGGDGEKKIVSAGDMVTFGVYPQTAEGNDETPIEWMVLDVQGDKALLISRYALDCKPYNTSYTSVTWESCSLRTWLNGTFLNSAFTAGEQTGILAAGADKSTEQGIGGSGTSEGKNTEDRIFLLSKAEAGRYLIGGDAGQCEPTAYAAAKGARRESNGSCWWWLRLPGSSSSLACDACCDGAYSFINVGYGGICVRPALWADLGSDIF